MFRKYSVKLTFITRLLNYLVIYMLILVIFLCILCTIFGIFFRSNNLPDYAKNQLKAEYIYYYDIAVGVSQGTMEVVKTFTAFFINYNTLIPLSLMVSLEILKSVQAFKIEKDSSLKEQINGKMKVLSLKIHEDLGNLKYVFTDKTGTLTQNEMEISAISIFSNLFEEEQLISPIPNQEDYPQMLEMERRANLAKDLKIKESKFFARDFNLKKLKLALKGETIPDTDFFPPNTYIQSLSQVVKELLLNIAMNNNVLIEKEESIKSNDMYDGNSILNINYQGSNPDEVTLVSAAKDLKIAFLDRDSKSIHLYNEIKYETYELLYKFDFTSVRMKSSIIIRDKEKKIKLYLKGADSVLLNTKKLSEFSSRHILHVTKNHLEVLAKKGLRTLCYAYRIIEESEFKSWEDNYNFCKERALEDKSKSGAVEDAISALETDLTLLGVTGITDKLQECVPETLSQLLDADINVWMLTGDKADTAESIGFSCKLFRDDSEIFKIKSGSIDETHLQLRTIILNMIKLEKDSTKNNFKFSKNQLIEPIKEIMEDYNSEEEDKSFSSFLDRVKENFEDEGEAEPKLLNARNKSFDESELIKKPLNLFKSILKNIEDQQRIEEQHRNLNHQVAIPYAGAKCAHNSSSHKCLLGMEERGISQISIKKHLQDIHSHNERKSSNFNNSGSPSKSSIIKAKNKARETQNLALNDAGNINSTPKPVTKIDTNDLQACPLKRKASFHYMKNSKKKKYKPHEKSIMKFMWDKDFFHSQSNSILERNLSASHCISKEKNNSIAGSVNGMITLKPNDFINKEIEDQKNIIEEFKDEGSILEVKSIVESIKEDTIRPEAFSTFNNPKKEEDNYFSEEFKNTSNIYRLIVNANKSAAVHVPHIQVPTPNNKVDIKQFSGGSTPSRPKGNLAALILSDDNKNNSTTTLGSLMKDYEEKIKLLNSKKKNFMSFNLKSIVSSYFKSTIETSDDLSYSSHLHFGLVIDGASIPYCLDPKNSELFWKLLSRSKSIICARCSPIQKAEIVSFVKKQSGEVTLAIGDGGNDVNMIKCANVGVGIFGKEGYQAAFNSDYALDSFKFLKCLVFKHGRFSLYRNSYFIYFFFFKNLIFTFQPFWFSLFNGFSGQQYFDDWYYLGYNSFIATLPIMIKCFNDEDYDYDLKNYKHKHLLK